jgi:fructokinase
MGVAQGLTRASMGAMTAAPVESGITVAGEALVDLVIQPDGGVAATLGGAPFTTARAAARLGAQATFVGALSIDRFGSLLAAQLEADGVRIASARTDLPTTLAAAELDDSGAASYRFYIEGTSAPALEPGDTEVAGSGIFFTGGLGLVLQPMADTVLAMVDAVDDSTTVVFDINCRPKVVGNRAAYLDRINRLLKRADIVKVSDDDLAYLSPGVDVLDAAHHLRAVGGAAVLVTAGASTTSIVTGDGVIDVPVAALDAPVVDSIGAGDTFGGALIAWWMASDRGRADIDAEGLRRAVLAAHAAAAVVVTRRGADPPRRADLSDDWV